MGKSILWSDESLQILKKNYGTVPKRELIKLLPDECKKSIAYNAKKLGLKADKHLTNLKENCYTQSELQILKEYYGKIDNKILFDLLPGRTLSSIYHKANRLGLIGDISITNRIYNVDDDFFSIPNPINSYIAGFIAADGCITRNLCKVCFGQKEKDVLEKLQEILDFHGKIIYSETRGCPCYHMNIASKKWVMDLKNNFNITPCKSLTLKPPPSLDYYLSLCFIIGLIDGDGCVCIPKPVKITHKCYIALYITSTIWVNEWVLSILKIGKIDYNMKNYTEFTTRYYCKGKKAEYIINMLRQVKELKDIRFTRKWDKILGLNNGL